MIDTYETTGDLDEQVYYERLDADREMAACAAEARQDAADRAAGVCPHSSTLGFRPAAFYAGQVGLTVGQARCTDTCGQVVVDDVRCYACDLGSWDCMGRRGYTDSHDRFVVPPMVLVSVAAPAMKP